MSIPAHGDPLDHKRVHLFRDHAEQALSHHKRATSCVCPAVSSRVTYCIGSCRRPLPPAARSKRSNAAYEFASVHLHIFARHPPCKVSGSGLTMTLCHAHFQINLHREGWLYMHGHEPDQQRPRLCPGPVQAWQAVHAEPGARGAEGAPFRGLRGARHAGREAPAGICHGTGQSRATGSLS